MLLGTLLTDKIFNIIDNKKVKAATKEQNNYLQAIFDAYNSGGSSRGIKENLGENSRFTPEIENYLDSLDEAKKKGQEVKASLEDFGDGSQFKRIAEEANETSEAMKKVGDTGKQAAEGTENIGEAAASAAEGMENVSKSSTTAGTSMSKVASVGKAVLGTLANIAIYYAISEAITLAAEAWDNYANAQENAIERGNTALANMDISIHTPARGVTAILSKNCKHFYFICTTIEPNHKQTKRPGTALIHKSNKFVYLFGASLPAFLCLLAVRTYPKRSMSDLRQLLCPLPNAPPLSDTYSQDNKNADCQPSHQ